MRETEQEIEIKPLVWVGSSHEDLKEFPSEVQQEIGYALYVAQEGDKHPKAKLLKGFSGVMEIRSGYLTNTYRAVYTTKNRRCNLRPTRFSEKSQKRRSNTEKRDRSNQTSVESCTRFSRRKINYGRLHRKFRKRI